MEFMAAHPQEIPQIRTVLAKALADDPLVQWHFPAVGDSGTSVPVLGAGPASAGARPTGAAPCEAEQERLSKVATYFMLAVERFVLQGRSFVAVDDGRVVAAALWMPPGMVREPSLPRPRDFMTQLLGREEVLVGAEHFTSARQGAPECAGHYLAQLGVLPQLQGSGVGSALMRHCLGALEGSVWAESANPRNVDFYRRLGFTVVHRAPLFGTTLTRLSLER